MSITNPTSRLMICLALFLAASGCSSITRTDLVESGHIQLDIVDTPTTTVQHAYVMQVNNQMVVRGEVGGQRQRATPFYGHVDLSILGPDDMVLRMEQASIMLRRRTRHVYVGNFGYRFDLIPAVGSKVRIAYHEEEHK